MTPEVSNLNTFLSTEGWSTQFTIDGQVVGGHARLHNDERLLWQMGEIGGVVNKRILELGPLDGGHTLTLIEHGAASVKAIEGYHPAWVRCLIIKELFNLNNAKFLYGDFCSWIRQNLNERFDIVTCNGVLYHQINPAELIFNLAKITKCVFLSTHFYERGKPCPATAATISFDAEGRSYSGYIQNYGDKNALSTAYCGGINQTSTWIEKATLHKILDDSGFKILSENINYEHPNGPWLNTVVTL